MRVSRVNLRLAVLGESSSFMDVTSAVSAKSKFINFEDEIEYFQIRNPPDLYDWQYSVKALSCLCPKRRGEDVLLVLVSVPIENNYILKRIGDSRLVLTTFEIGDTLSGANVSISNLILRMSYAASLMRICNIDILSAGADWTEYSHVETRGCIFDMTPHKYDIHKSCVAPIICSECEERLVRRGVSNNVIRMVRKN